MARPGGGPTSTVSSSPAEIWSCRRTSAGITTCPRELTRVVTVAIDIRYTVLLGTSIALKKRYRAIELTCNPAGDQISLAR